jgi:prephenate dehydrogenase
MTETVAIVGLGLMGGSLGLALRGQGVRVRGCARREATRADALRRGAVDEAFDDPAAAAEGAGRIVVCVPVRAIPELIRAVRPALRRGAVVTDVGSTKAHVSALCPPLLEGTGAAFVGSHPIAGSERQGIESARADLYRGALTVVTPLASAPDDAVGQVESLWRSVGSRVLRMEPGDHDRRLARTSHLPHLAAAALAAAVGRADGAEAAAPLCGPGFRDATRIAEGSADVWIDIVGTNREAVAAELDGLGERLAAMARAVRAGDDAAVRRLLEDGRSGRRRMLGDARRTE